ncbi:hypothetical protein DNTS_025517, partial [Danionella cerebrum]
MEDGFLVLRKRMSDGRWTCALSLSWCWLISCVLFLDVWCCIVVGGVPVFWFCAVWHIFGIH